MNDKPRFRMTDGERLASGRLFDHIEERIAAVVREMEQPVHDIVATSVKRGQIMAFREILRLATPPRTEELPPR